jgi:hypothetical protein
LFVEKKAHGTNQNIDGFYTKTTQKGGFSMLRPNRILTVELHRSFLYILFFQEKTVGDISFKLETKIMNFMSGFFRKKYNQDN